MTRSAMWGFALCGCLLGSGLTGWGAIYYVDGDSGLESHVGTNGWSDALRSVTNALRKASAGSEIWVKAGVYYPTAEGDRTKQIAMKAGVDLYGGFAGTETDRDQRDWTNQATVFSGDIGVPGVPTDNSYHVVSGATARIDGFVIRDGYADGTAASAKGAGMYTTGAYPMTANCLFSNNLATGGGPGGGYEGGGGVYWYQGTYTPCTVGWYNCTFDANLIAFTNSAYGGGMWLGFLTNTFGAISNCVFRNNIATGTNVRVSALYLLDAGQRVWADGAAFEVVDCLFSNNATYQYSQGAVFVNQFKAPVMFRDCQFVANRAVPTDSNGSGGALTVSINAQGQGLQMTRCVFDGNRAGWFGAGVNFIAPGGGTNSFWRNCMFRNNVSAQHGAAVYGVLDGTFDTCTFISNSCSGSGVGGAVVPNGAGSVTNDVFTNCTFTANTVGSGGGGAMQLYNPVTLQSCTFEGNSSSGSSGGAIVNVFTAGVGGTTVISRCSFTDNSCANFGGAIQLNNNYMTIRDSTFTRNVANSYGGALYSVAASTCTVSDCVFVSNRVTVNYGGGWYGLSPGSVKGSVFAGNTATNGYGGGICFRDFTNGVAQVANCVFRDNRAKYGGALAVNNAHAAISNVTACSNLSATAGYGGGVCFFTNNALARPYVCAVANSILWSDSPAEFGPSAGLACSYSDVKGGAAGTGNINQDPLFADGYLHEKSLYGLYAGGYFTGGAWVRSDAGSPALDAGSPAADWALEPAPNGGRINMGAYGNTPVASMSRFPARGSVLLIR